MPSIELTPAPLRDGEWQAPTFTNSWANLGFGLEDAGFKRDALGRVHLRGTIANGTNGQSAFTLPVGYRPSASLIFPIYGNAAFGYVIVDAAGQVVVNVASTASAALDGISFEPS